MRVGILSQWFDPEPGPAALPGSLARELVLRGHEVQVVTGFPNYPAGTLADGYRMQRKMDEQRDGVDVRRVALYPSHDASVRGRLLNYGSFAASVLVSGLSALREIDVLWVNYSPATVGVPLLVQRLRRRTPSVVHVLDLWPDTLRASNFARGDSRSGRAVFSALDGWCNHIYREADRVAYISPGVGKVLESRGVATSKLAYAPMWANEDLIGKPDSEWHRPRENAGQQLALVYAGTLGRTQGLEALIRACRANLDLDFVCLIAGSGTEEGRLMELAGGIGATNVHFLGRLSPEATGQLMVRGDLHFVSLNSDPLGMVTMPSKVQAALATGRPIMAAGEGDLARIVRASGGWAVPPGDVDALSAMLSAAVSEGQSGLARRGRSAREYYEREFSRDRGVSKIEGLLHEAIERRSR